MQTGADPQSLGDPDVLRPQPCEGCGDVNATFGPDPYQEDVEGDDTPHWLCESCRDQRADDI